MARRIIVHEPYDHFWPSRAVTHFPPGEYLVKDEVAAAAIAKGKASETNATSGDELVMMAPEEPAPAQAADDGGTARVDAAHVPDADRPAYGRGLDPAA